MIKKIQTAEQAERLAQRRLKRATKADAGIQDSADQERLIQDGMQNLVSGLGTRKARGPQSTLERDQRLDRIELENIYRNYWISKAVDIRPWDMTRQWRTFNCSDLTPQEIKAIETEEKRVDARNDVRTALVWASLYGGAGLVMHVDGQGKMDTPLDYTKIRKGQLNRLTPADRWELIEQGPINYNPLSVDYGKAEHYRIATDISNLAIHNSRIIFFHGRKMPIRVERQLKCWGESDVQRWYNAIVNNETLAAAIIEGVHQANVDVVSVKGLAQLLASKDGDNKAMNRFLTMDMAKSMLNMAVIDSEDTFTRNAFPFAGLPDIYRAFLDVLAAATDVPITRLLGSSPGGMNATGDSDTRNYYDSIKSEQENKLAPKLNQLDEVLIRSALGKHNPDIQYEFNSLWQLSGIEKATYQNQQANVLITLSNLGISPFALQRDAIELGLIRNLTTDDVDAAEKAAEFDVEAGNEDFQPPSPVKAVGGVPQEKVKPAKAAKKA